MIVTCNCQQCNGSIEFDVEQDGKPINCPHCGIQTTLTVRGPRRYVAAPVGHQTKNELSTLIGAGYITSAVFPLIGFIIGVILLAKNQVGSGLACVCLSVFCSIIWAILFDTLGFLL